jgi:Uma2 family endonuclease
VNLLLSQPQVETDQRFVIYGVDWETYEKFLAAVGDRHIFLTYDGENLELMVPSRQHEFIKVGLTLVVCLACKELRRPFTTLASTTLRRKDRKRGLETDDCFYIQHVQAILGKRDLDFTREPPPDLAIEVDISSSSLDREGVYAALGVPELWRCDGATLRFYQLNANRLYEECARSPTFPFIDPNHLMELLERRWDLDQERWERLLRSRLRKQLPSAKRRTSKNPNKKPRD